VLLAALRTVAGREKAGALLWTGSWTEPSVQTVRSGPSAAWLRGIRAGSASGARGRTSHSPPVVGSNPTRPTRDDAKSIWSRSRAITSAFRPTTPNPSTPASGTPARLLVSRGREVAGQPGQPLLMVRSGWPLALAFTLAGFWAVRLNEKVLLNWEDVDC
jgi:hypothetical protein